jgi:hypothetical protein
MDNLTLDQASAFFSLGGTYQTLPDLSMPSTVTSGSALLIWLEVLTQLEREKAAQEIYEWLLSKGWTAGAG